MTSFARRMTFLAIAAASLCASPAMPHTADGLRGGFVAGFEHPLSGPDHLLAMVAVGLWGAFLGRPLIYLLPIIFPTIMAFGGALGIVGVPFPPVEIGIGLSVLLLGGAIAAAWAPAVWVASVIVAIFGLFHGYAHGTELPSIADPIAYSCGFVLATGMLHLAGIGIGTIRDRSGGEVLMRVLGGSIALAGLWFLARAVGLA